MGARVAGRATERSERAAARPAPGEPPRDPEAAARRAAEREERVAAGVEDLRLWLRDAVRGGLGAGRLRAWDEWDGFAARMVDAQAPGAASRLRSLGSVAAGRPDGWPERLLSGLGLLHLLCEAHERADGPLRDDVRALLGWNVAREDVLARRARARPLGGARADGDRAGAPARRSGRGCGGSRRGRPALLLDFAPPGAPLEPRPPAGSAVDAELAFYPGATPLRALVAGETERARRRARDVRHRRRRGRARRRPRRPSPRTRGSTSGRSRSPPRSPTAATAARGRSRADDGALPLGGSERPAGACSPSPAAARCRVFGLWNGEALTPLAAGDGARTVAL